MYKSIFQNPKMALLFVAIVALFAAQLVGTADDAGALGKMEEALTEQRAALDEVSQPSAQIEPIRVIEDDWDNGHIDDGDDGWNDHADDGYAGEELSDGPDDESGDE